MAKDRSSRSQRSRMRWVIVPAVILVVLAVVAAWFAFGRQSANQAPAVDVVHPSRGTQTQTVSLSGTVAPQQQANVAFKVPGTVTSVSVEVGDRVTKGQRLASVGTRDLQNAVTVARANAAAARAQLSSARSSSQARDAQVEAARAQVRSAEANVTEAQNRLADAALTAPVAGTVAEVGYEVGDEVAGSSSSLGSALGSAAGAGAAGAGGAMGQGLPNIGSASGSGGSGGAGSQIVIVATNAWQLDAGVGTADLPSLKRGQKASITPTGTSTTVAGTVDTVGIVADQNSDGTATFPVTIRVDENSDKLYSGSKADATVTVGTFANVLTVPDTALTTQNGKSTVRLVRGTLVTPREIQAGRHFGGRVEITAGLTEADQIEVPRNAAVPSPTRPQFGPPSSTPSR
ncbi:efflux RND transporter periplasmic adaptor subunit [Nigerium massiliense]|uniref:efflux RND transporter periplasmic adaptor subunit n=1 Tax=Nigerium massiliense TaxID=1522317 RepID=UPI00138E37BB|nr:biotin/lipoyl-binding protein [Nigerium massiliense]